MSIDSEVILILQTSMAHNVCSRCPVAKDNNVTNLYDKCSKEREEFSLSLKRFNTIDGSQVTSYLGLLGLRLYTPLKNRFILKSFVTEGSAICEMADL